jgi:hypothetical protein
MLNYNSTYRAQSQNRLYEQTRACAVTPPAPTQAEEAAGEFNTCYTGPNIYPPPLASRVSAHLQRDV